MGTVLVIWMIRRETPRQEFKVFSRIGLSICGPELTSRSLRDHYHPEESNGKFWTYQPV
jgi:hypothetical protein